MPKERKYILTIGGFDPSGGAGVLADAKTFEQHKLIGMAVNTANTTQTEDTFLAVNWVDQEIVLQQLRTLLGKYQFKFAKIGLIEDLKALDTYLEVLKEHKVKVVWDPVLKASAGFDMQHDLTDLNTILSKVEFITPNWNEVQSLSGKSDSRKGAELLAQHCSVYLKGGHNESDLGRDFIYHKGKEIQFKPMGTKVTEKHGSGCVLSSALAANLTLGYPITKAVLKTKRYVTDFLESNSSLLGTHKK